MRKKNFKVKKEYKKKFKILIKTTIFNLIYTHYELLKK